MLTDHELPSLTALNALPTLEHLVVAGAFRLQVGSRPPVPPLPNARPDVLGTLSRFRTTVMCSLHTDVPFLLSPQVVASELELPLLKSLVLEDTYQPDPQLLPAELYASLPALESLVIAQASAHLARVWALRSDLHLFDLDDRLVQPTLQYADAVAGIPTLPVEACSMRRAIVQGVRKCVFPASLVFRAVRAAGSARVSVWPRPLSARKVKTDQRTRIE